MPETTLSTVAGEVGAYLAVPAGEPPWPGVVVLHELYGLDADIRGHADRFAARGYLALAPDLFSFRRPKATCVLAAFRALSKRSGPAFAAIEAARDAIARRADATGRVGVIGFCMGGGFALLAAPRGWFAASSVNYGVVPKDAAELLRGSCPIVASYGAKDRMMQGAADRLDAALAANAVDRDVREYPGASHSLLNRHTGTVPMLIDRIAGIGYDEPAAQDALRRIDAFFDRHVAERAG
ncbi:MAG: carboxymethylenebutenolidase [Solirubrobacteraceae bacterium]|jgi:carboxymethylenebutenolidase|nr:carboxymethylenebutenolidase [Solirubrobacteraceae bacterium]